MPAMKKIASFLVAVLAVIPVFHSCTDRNPDPVGPRYDYHFEIAGGETRAIFGDRGVSWETGDRVGLFPGSGNSVAAAVNMDTTPKTIDLSTSAPLQAGTVIYAYYPCQEGDAAASAARIVFPENQAGGAVSAMPLAGVPFTVSDGEVTNGSIFFLNLGSVIDFRVFSDQFQGQQVKSVTLTASSGGPVSGTATLDLTAISAADEEYDVPDLAWTVGKASVTLRQDAPVAPDKETASEGHLYMIVAPGTYSGSIAVITDVATYTFPFSEIAFKRNGLKRINLDLESPNALRGDVFCIENDRVKAYLDAVYAAPYDPEDYSYTHMKREYYLGNTTERYDWPAPVPVEWTNPRSGNAEKTVSIYNDLEMSDLELSVSVSDASATSAEVYNLIPGRAYYYTVTNGNDAEPLSRGTFATAGRRRMLKVGDSPYGMGYANNCRDFGGQMTIDGKRIRYGKLFRGSNMDKTSDEAKDVLLNYMDIGLDVDLRLNEGEEGDTPGDGKNWVYDALGLDPVGGHTTHSFDNWENLTDPAKTGDVLTRIMATVAAGKGVYIHCKVGADRTGYVCMLVEAILGVGQGWCDVDYELTSFSGAVDNGRARYRTGDAGWYNWESVNYYYRTKNGELRGVDFISSLPDAEYGTTFNEKAVNYVVKDLGVRGSDIASFREMMLEDI